MRLNQARPQELLDDFRERPRAILKLDYLLLHEALLLGAALRNIESGVHVVEKSGELFVERNA